jgi:ABC-type transport system substrate-binding protein
VIPASAIGTGTGPFELRERGRARLLLARNTAWWGSDRGLGPAIDQLQLVVVGDPDERLRLLREGVVQVAPLPAPLAASALRDPLLASAPVNGARGLTSERSVRGLGTGDTFPPMLNDVWRTEVGAG